MLPIMNAGNLAQEALLRSRAQQQDFGNGYMGSQIAPNWTPMLQALQEAGVGRITQGGGGLPPDRGLSGGISMGGPTQAQAPPHSTAPFSALADYNPGPVEKDTPDRKAFRKKTEAEADTQYASKYPGAL